MLEKRERGDEEAGGAGEEITNAPYPIPNPQSPIPNPQLHTNILKEFGYLVRQFGIS
ncbi:hypothetical protein ACWATR_11275 [Nostoc sp. UIC 10890]